MSRPTATAVKPHLRPARASAPADDEWVTVNEFCTEMKITRRTFDRWRAKRTGPRFERIGGRGPLRARRSWVNEWLGEDGNA